MPSVTNIAMACGFSSSWAFSRSFKRSFGVTAREYTRLAAQNKLPTIAPLIVEKTGSYSLPVVNVKRAGPLHLAYFASRNGYDPEITPLHKCRYFACMTVPLEFTDDATASFFDFPEHLCAVTRVECESVQEIQQAYRTFYRTWLPDSGFLMADLPPYDIIYNAPDVTPGGKYVFDLCVPVTVF